MQKLASEFENTSIVTKHERIILGPLLDVVINPENGNAIGILFKTSGNTMAANTGDITGVGLNFIMIESGDKVAEPDEIIRIKEVLDQGIGIIGSSVVNDTGRNLGKVNDWSVNLKTMRLERLYVTSSKLLKFIHDNLIITAQDIVKIEKSKITVRSGSVKSGKKIANLVKMEKTIRSKAAHIKMIDS